MKNDVPVAVCVDEFLELVTNIRTPIVITKNKYESAEKNFRINPANHDQWFNGNWNGVPAQINPNEALALHWVVHRSLIYIGRYCGTVPVSGDTGRNCLVLDDVRFYCITNMEGETEAHKELHAILMKPGAVTYSYYLPDGPIGEPSPQQFRMIQMRLEQPRFRAAVMMRYQHRCVVTGCTTDALLDAAHLPGRIWWLGHNTASDGIPLRVDVHRALDRGLIKLNEKHQLVDVSPELNGIYDAYRVDTNARS